MNKEKCINTCVTLSLRLLRLPVRRRLALSFGALVVCLGLYGLAFPSTSSGGLLLLPLVLSTWFFGWRGGILCAACITLTLAASYGAFFGASFLFSSWFVPFVTGTLYGLAVCLIVGVLRCVTKALLNAQHTITRAEQAYQQEQALNELKDQALQNLSHELRTPLTQIQGYLELLETYQGQFDAETQARFIASAQSGCEELLSLTETVLATAQPSTKHQNHCLSTFSLKHEVQTVLAHFEPQFLQGHCVELDIAEALQVHADPRFVRQVVRNLLTNACKYSPTQTRVTVSAAPMSASHKPHGQVDMICVRVQDQGPGIPPEQQSLLFQRFVRLPGASESMQPGSGLGLAICKQLVEALGGTIWLESTGRNGEGCCFSFTLASGSILCAPERLEHEESGNDQAKAMLHG